MTGSEELTIEEIDRCCGNCKSWDPESGIGDERLDDGFCGPNPIKSHSDVCDKFEEKYK